MRPRNKHLRIDSWKKLGQEAICFVLCYPTIIYLIDKIILWVMRTFLASHLSLEFIALYRVARYWGPPVFAVFLLVVILLQRVQFG
jgi:hypothetical protein